MKLSYEGEIKYQSKPIKVGHLLSGNPASLYELPVVVRRRGSAKARTHITPYQAATFPTAETQIPPTDAWVHTGHICLGAAVDVFQSRNWLLALNVDRSTVDNRLTLRLTEWSKHT